VPGEAVRVLEEGDHLFQLRLGVGAALDVGERLHLLLRQRVLRSLGRVRVRVRARFRVRF